MHSGWCCPSFIDPCGLSIKPVFFARYLSMCVRALVLLAALAITRLYEIPGVRRAASAAFVLIVVLSGIGRVPGTFAIE